MNPFKVGDRVSLTWEQTLLKKALLSLSLKVRLFAMFLGGVLSLRQLLIKTLDGFQFKSSLIISSTLSFI